ncbi:hypothetical protein SGRIM128S_06435 [Streptomyces griseomycini]
MAARGEDFTLNIDGVEHLRCTSKSIAPEAACTSVQLHLQVTPDRFADVWNAAQAVAAAQIAVGANSPFLFGRRTVARVDARCSSSPPTPARPEFRPRGCGRAPGSGSGGVTSAFDLFEENLRYFPALLPICDDEDPLEVLDPGGVPTLAELVLHNGTVYRWNRPVYGIADGVPHLRVENRVLPAGPTVTNVIANAAFYYGVVRALAKDSRPVWSRLPFEAAAANFDAAGKDGIDARLTWPRRGRYGGTAEVDAVTLVRDELLPLAEAGLDAWGIEPADRDLYLGVIEGTVPAPGQRRDLAGRDLPPGPGPRARPRGRAGRHHPPLPRADGTGRPGAHLAGGSAGTRADGLTAPRGPPAGHTGTALILIGPIGDVWRQVCRRRRARRPFPS